MEGGFIDNDALFNVRGAQADVWVVRDQRLQRQTLQLGLRSSTKSEVLRGLKAGDQVLRDPNQGQDAQRVRIEQVSQD